MPFAEHSLGASVLDSYDCKWGMMVQQAILYMKNILGPFAAAVHSIVGELSESRSSIRDCAKRGSIITPMVIEANYVKQST